MKKLLTIAMSLIALNSFAQNELHSQTDDYDPVVGDTLPSNHNYDPLIDDSVYYNYGGVGVNFELIGSDSVSGFAFGGDYNIGYMIDETYFIRFQSRTAAMADLFSNSSDPLIKKSHNFQLGAKSPSKVVDPFVIAEIEFNQFDQSSIAQNWVDLNTRFGAKLKGKVFHGLRFVATGSGKIGVTTMNEGLQLLSGLNVNLETIIFEKIGFYSDMSFSFGTDPLEGNEVSSGSLGYSFGMKIVF